MVHLTLLHIHQIPREYSYSQTQDRCIDLAFPAGPPPSATNHATQVPWSLGATPRRCTRRVGMFSSSASARGYIVSSHLLAKQPSPCYRSPWRHARNARWVKICLGGWMHWALRSNSHRFVHQLRVQLVYDGLVMVPDPFYPKGIRVEPIPCGFNVRETPKHDTANRARVGS